MLRVRVRSVGEWRVGGEGEGNDILLMQVANRLLCREGMEWSEEVGVLLNIMLFCLQTGGDIWYLR
jgi:hypothetical protein